MTALPTTLDMIETLVATPSISGSDPQQDIGNNAVGELLATWCEGLGFRAALHPVPGKPGHANMIATAGQGSGDQRSGGLVLAGHSDTVPFDESLWSSDPFALVERDGRFHGLGTTDMKAFFALALTAAARFDLGRLQAPLTIVATADEETGMTGARALFDRLLPGRHAVIGEPTSGAPVRMHKGNLMQRIRLTGQSGHSSNPAHGNSALEGMHAVITDLIEFRRGLQERYRHPGFGVPTPTLNFGCIHGGDNPNRICGRCELSFDLRLLPGMVGSEILSLLKERVEETARRRRLEVDFETIMDVVPGMETPADAAIVTAAERIAGLPSKAVSFTTEAPFYRERGLDTVVMGPGDIECAHQPDEFIRADRLDPTTDHLADLIQTFCMAPA